jgi:hypothetical protein
VGLVSRSGRGRIVTFVLLLSGNVIAVAVGGVADGTASSPSKIVIDQHGTSFQDSAAGAGLRGKFTINLRGLPFGPAGTTLYFGVPGNTRYVHGEAQIPFSGTDHLTSKKGRIDLAVSGTRIDVNQKVTRSGNVFGPIVRYGSWKIASATGIYQGWKGGGNFAAVFFGSVRRRTVSWCCRITSPGAGPPTSRAIASRRLAQHR